MSALAAASSNTATSPDYTFSSTGQRFVRVCADKTNRNGGGVITEPNEGNNCGAWANVDVSPAASLPDYIVENISINGMLTPGSILGFQGTVRNQGGDATVSSHTRLRIDIDNNSTWDVIPSNNSTAPIPAGGTELESWTSVWTAVAGTHLYQICADVLTAVPESNNSNNCADYTFTVNDISDYTLYITKSGLGTVISSPVGINCGLSCLNQSHEFESGIEVILTATPASGSIFTGWRGACSGTNNTCKVTMNSAQTVYAYFAVDPNYKEF
jgi:subtilase family serine protease